MADALGRAERREEALYRRSPLHGFASRFAATPASARIAEEPFVSMVDVWASPAVDDAVRAAAGADATIIWFGPDELLVTSTTRGGEELETALRGAIAPHDGAAADVSAQRTAVRLTGAHARDVLAKGCSLDLHPTVFGAGRTAQTMLAQAAVVLVAVATDDYRILVRSSFARYLAEWLLDAADEFG